MKSIVLNNEKCKFIHILDTAKSNRAKVFTQQEIADCLNISRRTIIDFENGKIFDFWLLCRYCDINGLSVKFWISD